MNLTQEQARDYMMKELTRKGLYVEKTIKGGLTISLTQFNLSCIYAEVDKDEIQFFIDNLGDEDIEEILQEVEDK